MFHGQPSYWALTQMKEVESKLHVAMDATEFWRVSQDGVCSYNGFQSVDGHAMLISVSNAYLSHMIDPDRTAAFVQPTHVLTRHTLNTMTVYIDYILASESPANHCLYFDKLKYSKHSLSQGM